MTEQTQVQVKTEQKLSPAEIRAQQIREARKGQKNWAGANSRYPDIGTRQGFVTHWFNDKAGRVERMLQLGWEFSKRAGFTDSKIDLVKEPNARIRIHAGTKEDGTQMWQYAMDIPESIWNEDRAERMKDLDRKEQYILGGKTDGDSGLKPDGVTVNIQKNNTLKPD